MAALHPLDRPVWSALTSGWAGLAQGDARAMRLDPAYGPFAAAADDGAANLAALAGLLRDDEESWTVEREARPAPPGVVIERISPTLQMIAERPAPPEPFAFEELGNADAVEMRALAMLTKPGPFRALTHRLGGFIGVRDESGRLVAMAGERMRAGRFTEVSGVCTHPDARGRGHAGRLMRTVAARIVARGETPFLHVYADNAGAIALYEALGYRRRETVTLTVLRRSA